MVMQNEWPIIGHTTAVTYLQRSILHGLRAHAFLFVGMPGVGKETMARLFAQALLCSDHRVHTGQQPSAVPCGACVPCRSFVAGTHPDIITVRRAEDKTVIAIEQVRELIGRLAHGSFLHSYHIAIIDRADELQPAAANAMLKLLEEPRERTLILMTAADERAVLPTIASRAQIIRCLPVPDAALYAGLVERGVARDAARGMAALACGRPGVAIGYAQDPESFAAARELRASLEAAVDGSRARRSALAASLKDADDPRTAGLALVADALGVLRGRLASAPRSAAAGMDALFLASERIGRSVSPQAAVEDALFSIHS